jgi:acetate kinase
MCSDTLGRGAVIKVLVINSGSSSIKYQLFNMDDGAVLASGAVERIGEERWPQKSEQP